MTRVAASCAPCSTTDPAQFDLLPAYRYDVAPGDFGLLLGAPNLTRVAGAVGSPALTRRRT